MLCLTYPKQKFNQILMRATYDNNELLCLNYLVIHLNDKRMPNQRISMERQNLTIYSKMLLLKYIFQISKWHSCNLSIS